MGGKAGWLSGWSAVDDRWLGSAEHMGHRGVCTCCCGLHCLLCMLRRHLASALPLRCLERTIVHGARNAHTQPPLQLNTGGGVWRAKWHPRDPELLLAACMYNGFAVLRAAAAGETETGRLEVLETYEHASGSLSYGADWCRDEAAAGGGGASLAATASFYDRQLHLWSYTA